MGRISYQKNHKFLIEVFNELQKLETNAVLMLVGVGEKEPEIREQVKRLKLEEKVRFLGNRSDVNELYQAMDVFVLPSLFEGIPVVGIEAHLRICLVFFQTKYQKKYALVKKADFLALINALQNG